MPGTRTVEAYLEIQKRLGFERVIVVQPNAYGDDNEITLASIARIGAGARGVAVVRPGVSDAELVLIVEVLRQLAAVKRRDPRRRQLERRAQLRGTARYGARDLVRADPQLPRSELLTVEARRILEQRRVALGLDPGEDRRDLPAQALVARPPLADQPSEARCKVRRVVVEAGDHLRRFRSPTSSRRSFSRSSAKPRLACFGRRRFLPGAPMDEGRSW